LCLKHRNKSTGTSDIDSAQAGIKFHNVGACRHWKVRDRFVSVYTKDRKRSIPTAEDECTMMFRINGHAMIELAAIHGIFPQQRVCCRIDLRDFICVSEIYVDLACR